MKITFKPLWKQLIDKNMMKKQLYEVVSPAIVAKMGRDENITTEMIVRLCNFLNCDIADIIQLENDNKPQEQGEM